jgi:small subunit ribosomal protein S4
MSRYTGPVCRLCRREGEKLFLKGMRCFTDKCAIERRNYPPGQHGLARSRRRRLSDYGVRLREKQKVKRIYGLAEGQFRNLFDKALRMPGVTGENLVVALESRLDNIVYRMGFAPSRKAARQLVRHRHVSVNGRPVDVPSYSVRPGEEIRLKEKSREMPMVKEAMERQRDLRPSWLAVDEKAWSGRMLQRPTRADIPLAVQEQLIVELYSR